MTDQTTFDLFWSTWPSDLCNRKGSKPEAQSLWEGTKKCKGGKKIEESDHEHILTCLRELMRAARKQKKRGDHASKWKFPMVDTWLRNQRWLDIEEIEQSQDVPVDVRLCSCGKLTQHLNECFECYYERSGLKKANDDRLLANLGNLGLAQEPGESRKDWNARCKAHYIKEGGMGALATMRSRVSKGA